MIASIRALIPDAILKRKLQLTQPNANLAAGKQSRWLAKLIAAGDQMAFSWPVRQGLYRHLSAQVGNGIQVELALDTFRARLQRRKKLSSDKIIADIAKKMRDGHTLAAALRHWVPEDEASVISSGELSGNVPQALDLVIEVKRRVANVNNALKSAMVSPAIYIAAVYAMVWAIGRYVIPALEQALPKEKATGIVYGLYVTADFANSWWALLPPLIAAFAVYSVVLSLPKWTGPNRVRAENYFPYSFYRDIQGYTWLMGFTALLRVGMPDVEILKRQKEHATPWLKERVAAFWWRMDNGSSLSAALMSKGKGRMPAFGFPNPDIVDDINSMDGFIDFSERISVLGMQWADELESATMARARSFGQIAEILMYAVIGLLMFAINSMSSQMGTAGM